MMMSFADPLSAAELNTLAQALKAGRLRAPFGEAALGAFVSATQAASVAAGLSSMASLGASNAALACFMSTLANERLERTRAEDAIDLVTSGPEDCGVTNRDTSVVVRELFVNAVTSVLVVGYAVYQGARVFAALAERMNTMPALQVRMFLDIQRSLTDTSVPAEHVRRFARRFRTKEWPAHSRLPAVYFYPRSLEDDPAKRASLHAKCVVVDQSVAFVSSANFTEAAQERNIEVGLLVHSPVVASRITRHFDALVANGRVIQLDLNPRGSQADY